MDPTAPCLRAPRAALIPLAAAIVAATAALPARAQPTVRDEIVVTSSIIEQPRRQIGTAVAVIDIEEIELRGYQDLADVLRTQTGIAVSNSGGPGQNTAVRVRGEEAYRTLLMIDGVKAVNPTSPQVAPRFDSLLTTGDLQRVEVLRGPQGFMYGADAGGVVSLLTARGSGDLGGRVGLEYGERDTAKYDVALSGGGDAGDYFLSATDLRTDGFNAQTSDTVLRDADGANNTTLHAKLGWNATERLRLQLVARDIDASTDYDGCFSLATFATVHDCAGTSAQRTYKLSAEQSGARVSHALGYSNVDLETEEFAQGLPSFGSVGELSQFEYTGSFKASAAATLVYGVDLQEEQVTDSTATRQRDQDGYYFEYQGALVERLFLTLGARYDDNEDFGSHTSTRVSAAYVQDLRSGHSLKYRASIGTGFRAPSLFETGYNRRPFGVHPQARATPLEEEESQGYDVGIEYVAANGLRFEATYFDHEIEDQIEYLFGSPPAFDDGYVQTPGKSESSGIEIGVDAPLGEQWSILANWTRNDAATAAGAPRLRRPEDFGNIGLRFVAASEAFGILANFRVARDAVDVGNVPLDDYGVLDLSLAYSINDALDVYGRIQNANDDEYEEVAGFNTAGRSVYAGVRLSF